MDDHNEKHRKEAEDRLLVNWFKELSAATLAANQIEEIWLISPALAALLEQWPSTEACENRTNEPGGPIYDASMAKMHVRIFLARALGEMRGARAAGLLGRINPALAEIYEAKLAALQPGGENSPETHLAALMEEWRAWKRDRDALNAKIAESAPGTHAAEARQLRERHDDLNLRTPAEVEVIVDGEILRPRIEPILSPRHAAFSAAAQDSARGAVPKSGWVSTLKYAWDRVNSELRAGLRDWIDELMIRPQHRTLNAAAPAAV